MRRIREIGRLPWESRLLIGMRWEVRVVAEGRGMLFVWVEAVAEVGSGLPLRVAKEELKVVEAEVEARDSMAEKLEEAEAVAEQEMMRRSYEDSVVEALVGSRAQNLSVLRGVGEQVQKAEEEAVPRESETVC